MKPKNISFITPLTNKRKYILDKEYSMNLVLNNGSEINISSHIGPKEDQEDSVAILENRGYILLLVADGMGGHEKGNEASYITAKTIQKYIASLSLKQLDNLTEFNLKMSINKILNQIKNKYLPKDSGTTLNMSLICPDKTFVINIGDSRTYTIKNDNINLLTKDDSLSFKTFCPISAEERDNLRFYKQNNVITKCIGLDSLPTVRIKTINNDSYDAICHMTDGISDILDEETIKKEMLQQRPAESLVKKAISMGPIINDIDRENFYNDIAPHDNASAIVYTKKRIKNN